jgi:hypothetical protein
MQIDSTFRRKFVMRFEFGDYTEEGLGFDLPRGNLSSFARPDSRSGCLYVSIS